MTGGRSLNTSDFKERQSEYSTTGNDRGLKKKDYGEKWPKGG